MAVVVKELKGQEHAADDHQQEGRTISIPRHTPLLGYYLNTQNIFM